MKMNSSSSSSYFSNINDNYLPPYPAMVQRPSGASTMGSISKRVHQLVSEPLDLSRASIVMGFDSTSTPTFWSTTTSAFGTPGTSSFGEFDGIFPQKMETSITSIKQKYDEILDQLKLLYLRINASTKTNPGPLPMPISSASGRVFPFLSGVPSPPTYGFQNLERRTIVLANGTAGTYLALPPDYPLDHYNHGGVPNSNPVGGAEQGAGYGSSVGYGDPNPIYQHPFQIQHPQNQFPNPNSPHPFQNLNPQNPFPDPQLHLRNQPNLFPDSPFPDQNQQNPFPNPQNPFPTHILQNQENFRSEKSVPKLKRRRSKVQCRSVSKNYWRKYINESLEDEISPEEMQVDDEDEVVDEDDEDDARDYFGYNLVEKDDASLNVGTILGEERGEPKCWYGMPSIEASAFEQKQSIVPKEERKEFMRLLKKPLPTAFRINSSAQFFQDIRQQLENDFMKSLEAEASNEHESESTRPLPWYPDNLAWHLNFSRMQLRKNQTIEGFHEFLKQENEVGNITRQEAVSMVPPLFLDVLPHHHVLDMCAAPGSKTFQLLEIIHQSKEPGLLPDGLVIANDVDVQRCNLLTHQTKRMCSANLIVTNHEAQHFPGCSLKGCMENSEGQEEIGRSILQFDRVLCNVPCSGDDTLWKDTDIWRKGNAGMGNGIHRLQVEIVMRDMALLKVGGRLVYSTCSMSPIENEAVVAEVLDVSRELPELIRRHGLLTWKVRDRGLWLASDKDVPKYRKSAILPSMFPSDHSFNKDEASLEVQDDAMALDNDVGPENISYSKTHPSIPMENENGGEDLETNRSPVDDSKGAGQMEELSSKVEVSRFPLKRCIRILPHDQNTGTFFIAILQKVSSLHEDNKNHTSNGICKIPLKMSENLMGDQSETKLSVRAVDASMMDEPSLETSPKDGSDVNSKNDRMSERDLVAQREFGLYYLLECASAMGSILGGFDAIMELCNRREDFNTPRPPRRPPPEPPPKIPSNSLSSDKKRCHRRASAEDKELAKLAHKVHLLCLLARGRLVDNACNNPLIQASLLSLLPSYLLKIKATPRFKAQMPGPLVRLFHGNFHVRSQSVDKGSFHSNLSHALGSREGSSEEIAALSVALFRVLDLTTWYVSVLGVASLKSEAAVFGTPSSDAPRLDTRIYAATSRLLVIAFFFHSISRRDRFEGWRFDGNIIPHRGDGKM